MEEMESTRVEKESLAQKCHELEMKLNLMKEEKSNLSGELIQAELEFIRNPDNPVNPRPNHTV